MPLDFLYQFGGICKKMAVEKTRINKFCRLNLKQSGNLLTKRQKTSCKFRGLKNWSAEFYNENKILCRKNGFRRKPLYFFHGKAGQTSIFILAFLKIISQPL